MADGAGIESLANAVIKLTGEVSEMRGEMRGFMDHRLAAAQRVEIRAETESMIAKSVEALGREIMGSRGTLVSEAKSEQRAYTDSKIKELEARFAAQEERDSKREAQIRQQQIAMAGMVVVVIVYAVVQNFGGAI